MIPVEYSGIEMASLLLFANCYEAFDFLHVISCGGPGFKSRPGDRLS
jgi:hypothetical protein